MFGICPQMHDVDVGICRVWSREGRYIDNDTVLTCFAHHTSFFRALKFLKGYTQSGTNEVCLAEYFHVDFVHEALEAFQLGQGVARLH